MVKLKCHNCSKVDEYNVKATHICCHFCKLRMNVKKCIYKGEEIKKCECGEPISEIFGCVNQDFFYDNCKDFLLYHPSIDAMRILGLAIEDRANEEENILNLNLKGIKLDYIIAYCIENEIPKDTDRHSKLFKNIGIYLANEKTPLKKVTEIDEKILRNCKDKRKGSIVGWFKWAQRRKTNVNYFEMKKFLELISNG